MIHEKSGIVAMLRHECPSCKQTSIYKNPSVYTFVEIGAMHKVCPVCHTNLSPEIGFYFGAAYVSWGLTVALWISVLVVLKVLDAIGAIEFGFLTHPVTFLTSGAIATLVAFPYLFRVSRSIWAHMFIKKNHTTEPS